MIRPQPANSLCDHLDSLLEELRKTAPRAIHHWDQDAIHDARVITRRLKAAVDLLESLMTSRHRKPFAKGLRNLRKQLGPLRDLDVMLEHLKDNHSQRQAGALLWITSQLTDEREAQRQNIRHKASPAKILARLGNWWGLREELNVDDAVLKPLLRDSLHRQLEDFVMQADRLTPSAQQAVQEHDDPHGLRIAGKLLRYTLEIAEAAGTKLPREIFKDFKRMQTALGLWHDYFVLNQTIYRKAMDEQIGAHDRGLYEQMIKLSQQYWRRAETQLKRFSKIWQERGSEVAQTIRQAFPNSVNSQAASETKDPASTDAMQIPPQKVQNTEHSG